MRKSTDLPKLIIDIKPISTQDQLDEFITNDLINGKPLKYEDTEKRRRNK